jgi:hypothetical protein
VTIATLRVFKSIEPIVVIPMDVKECTVVFGAMYDLYASRTTAGSGLFARGNMLARGSNVDPLRVQSPQPWIHYRPDN